MLSSLPALHHALLRWFVAHGRDLPWRHTRDPYHILVAEVMLQQTQVERVVPKYYAFLTAFPDLSALAAAPTAAVIRAWSGLGYNRRAINLQRVARAAVERFGGTLPANLSVLTSLPGIGRYTAAAIACFAFELPVPVVETNIRRVLARLSGRPEPLPEREAWALAAALLPEPAWTWNQALMDLGATICTVRAPRCLICPLRELCPSRGAVRSLAEARPAYASQPFVGSNRWYRGRVIALLRELPPGTTLDLETLGRALRPAYSPADRPWLQQLVAGLAADGLLHLDDETVALP
ncbi:MAG: A/G-specific adenine glycosylase [Chloroflexi bacterium]|nr:A/G-specific adenine glycosylase [Chloroflexota bacterium]